MLKTLGGKKIQKTDETGLLWKCLPQRTLVSCGKKSAPGFKKAKDRLTVLGCTNATGTHKLKPVLIGKSAKPDPVQVMQLRRMMDFAMRSRYKTLKQTSMFQFFRSDE